MSQDLIQKFIDVGLLDPRSTSFTENKNNLETILRVKDSSGILFIDEETVNDYLMFVMGFLSNFNEVYGIDINIVWVTLAEYVTSQTFISIKELVLKSKVMEQSRRQYDQEIDTSLYKPKQGEGVYKCGRCKSNKVDTQAFQLRSADEPVTVLLDVRFAVINGEILKEKLIIIYLYL